MTTTGHIKSPAHVKSLIKSPMKLPMKSPMKLPFNYYLDTADWTGGQLRVGTDNVFCEGGLLKAALAHRTLFDVQLVHVGLHAPQIHEHLIACVLACLWGGGIFL